MILARQCGLARTRGVYFGTSYRCKLNHRRNQFFYMDAKL